jgi:two-component system phosphate regulon sensor histidine kinase PhoR
MIDLVRGVYVIVLNGIAGNLGALWQYPPLAITTAGGWIALCVCLGLLVVGLIGAIVWILRVSACERKQLLHYVDAVCNIAPEELMSPGLVERIPRLPPGPFWHAFADRVRESLEMHGRWIQDQYHARTAIEIRATRAAAELARIQRVLAGVPDPVLAFDEFGEMLFANPSAEELFGFESEKAEDRAMARLVHCEKLLQLLTATGQRKTPGHRSEEMEIVDPAGQTHWFRVTAAKLGGDAAEDGNATVAVLRDIGEHKALQKRNAEFVSSVSHEMKTPLAGIKAYVELLADGDAEDEETREEFLGVINGQAERLQRLVENLLNLARIEAGVVKVSKQARSLNEILEEAFRVVHPTAEAKHIELTTELSPMYLGVLADRDMLLQAAINLLSNAIKYTHPNGRVTLRSRLVDGQARFEVADTGVGLSPEDSQRVFEKFYRVNKDKNMAAGTGLGLPLAKHIVEDVHGGRLTVESVLGEGSTFIATLPCAAQISA